MQNKSDALLLREYAVQRSEPAFAEIVARHTDLVYSAACRQTGSPELAREIAQSVFTDLARKARLLAGSSKPDACLAGWLYRGTRFATLTLLRGERRRQAHEKQFMEHFNPASETAPDWERVAPVLDEAMAELGDDDREAVLLRFFKNQDFHSVGLALGVSDAAAQRRVSRAVERLREFFAKRGVTVGASSLVVVISANAVQAAPIGLAGTFSTAAVLAGTTLTTTATGFSTTLIKLMASTKIKMAGLTVALGLGVGTGIVVQERALANVRVEHRALKTQTQPLNELRAENERLAREASLQAETAKRRQEISRLRSSTASAREELRRLATQQISAANGRVPAAQRAANAPESFQLAAMKDVGALTPMAAVQTSFWALRSQNAERLKELFYVPENLAGAEKQQFEKALEDGIAAQIRKASLPGWEEYQEIRLLKQTPTKTENEFLLAVQLRGTADWKSMNMTVRRVNDQWKFIFQGGGRPEGGTNESK